MLPSIRHRLMISVAVIVAAICWSMVAEALKAPDGSTGIVLFEGSGVVENGLIVMLAGLPVLALALLTSAAGNPLSGVFVGASSLCMLAGLGGPADGWLRRATLPDDALWLIAETIAWALALGVVIVGIAQRRQGLSRWVRWLQSDNHLGGAIRFGQTDGRTFNAGALCAAAGAALSFLILRTTDGGQVIGSLILGYLIGAFLAQMVIAPRNPVGILMSPFVVAVGTYTYILINFDNAEQMYGAWFDGSLPASAMVLPIQYASAGVAGSALGIGLAQSFDAARADASATKAQAT